MKDAGRADEGYFLPPPMGLGGIGGVGTRGFFLGISWVYILENDLGFWGLLEFLGYN